MIFPDEENAVESLTKIQLNRFAYLDEETRREIVEHIYQDNEDKFLMKENRTFLELKKADFKKIDKIELS